MKRIIQEKLNIREFMGGQTAAVNANTVKELFLKIPVREFCMTLISQATQNGEVRQAVEYMNIFIELNKKIPRLCEMTIRDLLWHASGLYTIWEGETEEADISLGNTIVSFLLVDAFCNYSMQQECTYEDVLQKLVKKARQ